MTNVLNLKKNLLKFFNKEQVKKSNLQQQKSNKNFIILILRNLKSSCIDLKIMLKNKCTIIDINLKYCFSIAEFFNTGIDDNDVAKINIFINVDVLFLKNLKELFYL